MDWCRELWGMLRCLTGNRRWGKEPPNPCYDPANKSHRAFLEMVD